MFVAAVAVTAVPLAFAGPASAKGPAPASVTLNCPDGVYSYLQGIAIYDRTGNSLVPGGRGSLECGSSVLGTSHDVGLSLTLLSGKPVSYCFTEWDWEVGTHADSSPQICYGGPLPLPNGGKPVLASDSYAPASGNFGPAGLTFTVG
jgi:hypothetical protein